MKAAEGNRLFRKRSTILLLVLVIILSMLELCGKEALTRFKKQQISHEMLMALGTRAGVPINESTNRDVAKYKDGNFHGPEIVEDIGSTSLARDAIAQYLCSEIIAAFLAGNTTTSMKNEIILKPMTEKLLEKKFPMVKNGHFSPLLCQPRQKIAIVIPFRNRWAHLFILLLNLLPILIKQGLEFTVFVVEQDLPQTFNKGVVLNAGFIEALKLDDFDCFIFHDVDMLPLSLLNLYQCHPNGPVHFMAGVNKFEYNLLYHWLIGGVLGFTKNQFLAVNGFSNLYFGWGSEDDDMSERIASVKLKIYRRPKSVGLYDMLRHRPDKRWSPNQGRFMLRRTSRGRQAVEGVRTVQYTLTQFTRRRLFLHICIAVDVKKVFKVSEK